MTATVLTESRRISPSVHNWLTNIKSSKKMMVIITILHLVAVPSVLISLIADMYTNKSPGHSSDMYVIIAIITTCIAALMGILIAVDSFKCLHDKSVVDMKLALPMSASQRFFSNFFSGLFTYIAPFLGAQVLSLLLTGYGLIFMEGKTFYREIWDYDLQEYVLRPYECEIFGMIMSALLKAIVGGILCMLMLYTLTVLITVCCESKFESIAYTLLINIIIPATVLCVLYAMFDSLYGINAENTAFSLIIHTTVAGGVAAVIDWVLDGNMLGSGAMNYTVWLLVFTLITVIFGALSFFLYRKRRAEQVSKPFVFKLVYYIILTCGMFCIVSLFGFAGLEYIVPEIITTAITYMIFEVITNRGFKRFWLSAIKFVATIAAAHLVLFIGDTTEGFGAVQRVPSASSVKSIELDYDGFYGDFPIEYNNDTKVLITDAANIETVIEAHQATIDFYNDYKENANLYNNYYNVQELHTVKSGFYVTYNLKTGGSFTREYDSYCAETAEILGQLDLSDEYKRQIAEKYKNKILSAKKNLELMLETDEDYVKTDRYNEFIVELLMPGIITLDNTSNSTTVKMLSLNARGFFEQLAEAYYNDIMAINEDNYYHSKLKNVWELYIRGSGRLMVPESFENTVQLLEYFDFGLVRIEDISNEELIYNAMHCASSSGVWLLTDDEWRNLNQVGDVNPLHASYENYYRSDNFEYYVYNFDENFCELVRSAMPRNIVEENGYIIYMFDFSGAIPMEMTDIAAAVARSGYNDKIVMQYNDIVYGQQPATYYD